MTLDGFSRGCKVNNESHADGTSHGQECEDEARHDRDVASSPRVPKSGGLHRAIQIWKLHAFHRHCDWGSSGAWRASARIKTTRVNTVLLLLFISPTLSLFFCCRVGHWGPRYVLYHTRRPRAGEQRSEPNSFASPTTSLSFDPRARAQLISAFKQTLSKGMNGLLRELLLGKPACSHSFKGCRWYLPLVYHGVLQQPTMSSETDDAWFGVCLSLSVIPQVMMLPVVMVMMMVMRRIIDVMLLAWLLAIPPWRTPRWSVSPSWLMQLRFHVPPSRASGSHASSSNLGAWEAIVECNSYYTPPPPPPPPASVRVWKRNSTNVNRYKTKAKGPTKATARPLERSDQGKGSSARYGLLFLSEACWARRG